MKLQDYLNVRSKLTFFGDRRTKGSIEYCRAWYQQRHPLYRIAYRVSGLLLLLLAFFIPLWVAQDQSGPKLLAGLGSFVVGLATFFSFKHGWAGYYLAQFQLEALKEQYEEAIHRATLLESEDEQKAVQLAIEATQGYMKSATEVVTRETEGYFSSTSLPAFLSVGKKR